MLGRSQSICSLNALLPKREKLIGMFLARQAVGRAHREPMPEGLRLNVHEHDDNLAHGPCSPPTIEEAHDRMLHPERYEAAAQVLTLTPSGDTEFNTAQQAGSTGASLPGADEDQDLPGSRKGTVAEQVATEELWDESFKAPTTLTLQRSNSPTSTLADRFISAGMYQRL